MKKHCILYLPLFIILASCAKNTLTGDAYPRRDVRVLQDIKFGKITDIRHVKIEGGNETGGMLGLIAGGVLGGLVGGGNTAPTVSFVGGSLLGGVIGSQVEQKMNSRNGLSITVRMFNSEDLVHVVQEVNPREEFLVGDRVRLVTTERETRISH